MTEKEFEALRKRVLRQLGFINKELLRKQPLDIVIQRSGLTREEIELIGYGYKEESNQMGRFREVEYEDLPDHMKEQPKNEIEVVNKSNQLFTDVNEEQADQLQEMLNNYPVIMEMVNRFKQNKEKVLEAGIVIELPFDDDKQINKSFRLNGVIAKQWEEFCKIHKQFTVKDLASMALKEYMDKHR